MVDEGHLPFNEGGRGSKMSDEEALALCISVMKNITYCFNSVTAASWDINCKHPSCMELLLNTIDKVEGR